MVFRRRNRHRPPAKRISRGQALAIWERYLERALAEVDKGDKANLQEALEDIEAALDHSPNLGELHAAKGLVLYMMTKRDDEAQDCLNFALALDRHQWMSYYVRGLIAIRSKDYHEAVEQLSMAQRYVPTRSEVLQVRAMAYWGQGRVELAVADMEKAIEYLPAKDKRAKAMKTMLNDFQKEADKYN